jgi:hypothetical protein
MSQTALMPMSLPISASDALESAAPKAVIDQPAEMRPGLFMRIMEAIGRSYAPLDKDGNPLFIFLP